MFVYQRERETQLVFFIFLFFNKFQVNGSVERPGVCLFVCLFCLTSYGGLFVGALSFALLVCYLALYNTIWR